jgi:hypothetical protein
MELPRSPQVATPSVANGASAGRGASAAKIRFPERVEMNLAGAQQVPGTLITNPGRMLSASTDASRIMANYQRYHNEEWLASVARLNAGKITIPAGLNWKTELGQVVDARVRRRMMSFLAREGIAEGPGASVLVNRWLRDPSGTGEYGIPDVRLLGNRTILEGTIGAKTLTSPQMQNYLNFSGGDGIIIVRPQVGPLFGGGQ